MTKAASFTVSDNKLIHKHLYIRLYASVLFYMISKEFIIAGISLAVLHILNKSNYNEFSLY